MQALPRSEAYKIVLPLLFAIQFIVVAFNAVLLIKRRNIYPIKQLSPRLTLLISLSILISSAVLLVCKLTNIHKTNDSTLAFMNILYVFSRQFIIIAFYMRCLRICAAYFHTQSQFVVFMFSRQIIIALFTSLVCIIPCIVQTVQYSTTHDVNQMTNFFPFYVIGIQPNTLDFFPLWAVDNSLFFVVLLLSLKVHDRFKFIKTLIAACGLFHLQSFYSLIGMLSDQLHQEIRTNFEYVIMSIHTIFLWLLLSPSLRPNQFEHPLPLQTNISYPNTALLDKQTYLIISQFADQLQERSMANEERRRQASTWLLVYTVFKITQRRIAEIQLKPETSVTEEQDDQLEIRQLLYDYVYYHIVPYLHILLIRQSVQDLFQDGQQMGEDTIREDLEILHFRKLNRRLDDAISHIFREWKKTNSCEYLRQQLKKNSKIITTMTKLKIGI